MKQQILKGKAPIGITDVHVPKVPNEQLHAHFVDGSALNVDGSWKHGEAQLSSNQKDWLVQNGWDIK